MEPSGSIQAFPLQEKKKTLLWRGLHSLGSQILKPV